MRRVTRGYTMWRIGFATVCVTVVLVAIIGEYRLRRSDDTKPRLTQAQESAFVRLRILVPLLEILAYKGETAPPRAYAEFVDDIRQSIGTQDADIETKDLWGTPLILELVDDKAWPRLSYVFRSCGPDRTPYTDDDVTVDISVDWKIK